MCWHIITFNKKDVNGYSKLFIKKGYVVYRRLDEVMKNVSRLPWEFYDVLCVDGEYKIYIILPNDKVMSIEYYNKILDE